MSHSVTLAEGMERIIHEIATQSDSDRELWRQLDFGLEIEVGDAGRYAEATCLRKDGTQPALRTLVEILGLPTRITNARLHWRWVRA
jgi:hypothetical protein